MPCFSLPSVGYNSLYAPTLTHFLFSFSGVEKYCWRSSVTEPCLVPLSYRGSLVSLRKKKLRLIINISLTYNAQQALKEPAGRGKLTPMGGEASITSLWSYCHFNLWPQFNIWHTIRCSDYALLRYKKQKWNKLLRFCWRRVSLCLSTVQFSFVTSWIYD